MQLSPIYVFLLVSLFTGFITENKRITTFNILFMLCLGIMRAITVGTDCLGYRADFVIFDSFKDEWKLEHDFEPGFLALIWLFKHYIVNNYPLFVSLIFFPFMLGSLAFIKRKQVLASIALFVLFMWGFYFNAYNIMRQMMCVGLLLYCTMWLDKGKYYLYIFSCILISYLFHTSGVVMILLAPLHYLWKKHKIDLSHKLWLWSALIGSWILFFYGKTFLQGILMPVILAIDGSYQNYIVNENKDLGYLFSLGQTLIACYLVYFHKRGQMDFELSVFVLGVVFYNLMSMFSVYAPRVAIYFLIYAIVFIPNLIQSVKESQSKRQYKLLLFGVIAYSFYRFISMYCLNNTGEVNPYTFRF